MNKIWGLMNHSFANAWLSKPKMGVFQKLGLTLACFFLLTNLMACSKTPQPLTVKVTGTKDKATDAYAYRGGLFKVWIKLDQGVATDEQVRWKTGKGDIALRNSAVDNAGLIIADTVYLHWEALPKVTMVIDTSTIKVTASSGSTSGTSSSSTSATSTKRTVYDTTYHYFDTVAVVVDGEESGVEVVEIFNILPRIDSVEVGGIGQPGDSVLTFAVHPGERMDIAFHFKDAYNTNFPVQDIIWPDGIGDLAVVKQSDSTWTWSWYAPNSLIDTVLPLVLTDKGGFGTREYKLKLIVYDEAGSAWVVSGDELVKFSSKGSEVARVLGPFSEVSDLVLNSNTTIGNKLWVVDIGNNVLSRYDAYGRLERRDSATFSSPFSIAVDVESRLVWVSSLATISNDTLYSSVQRYDLNGLDTGLATVGAAYKIAGPVKGLSVDQFEQAMVWFVSPEEDFVGYIRSGASAARVFRDTSYHFNRPSIVSYDPVSGTAWITDSSRVIVLDTAGEIRATITGFRYANSLSAGGGVCWVSDIIGGAVYKFPMSLTGKRTISDGLEVTGFISPASLSTFAADQSVWVADKGAGEVVRVDASGARVGSGTGLTLPTLIRVHQVIE